MLHRVALLALLFGLAASSVLAADIPAAVYKAPVTDKPQWTIAASFDLLTLERRKGAGVTLAPGLSSSDFDFGQSPGADLKVEVGFANLGAEARYIGQFGWSDQQSVMATTLLTNPNINFGPRLVPIGYASNLNSWELNAFWKIAPRWKVFGGYREFRIGETLSANLTAATFTVSSGNQLSGFQAGLAARVFEGSVLSPSLAGFYGDVVGRWGLYRNSARLAHLPVGVGGAVSSEKTDSANATVLELEAKVGYALSPNADLHVGYRYLRFDRVVLAPDNYTSVNIVTGAGTPVYSKAEYQGFFGGVQVGF